MLSSSFPSEIAPNASKATPQSDHRHGNPTDIRVDAAQHRPSAQFRIGPQPAAAPDPPDPFAADAAPTVGPCEQNCPPRGCSAASAAGELTPMTPAPTTRRPGTRPVTWTVTWRTTRGHCYRAGCPTAPCPAVVGAGWQRCAPTLGVPVLSRWL